MLTVCGGSGGEMCWGPPRGSHVQKVYPALCIPYRQATHGV